MVTKQLQTLSNQEIEHLTDISRRATMNGSNDPHNIFRFLASCIAKVAETQREIIDQIEHGSNSDRAR